MFWRMFHFVQRTKQTYLLEFFLKTSQQHKPRYHECPTSKFIFMVLFTNNSSNCNNFILLLATSSLMLQEYSHALLNLEPQVQSQK